MKVWTFLSRQKKLRKKMPGIFFSEPIFFVHDFFFEQKIFFEKIFFHEQIWKFSKKSRQNPKKYSQKWFFSRNLIEAAFTPKNFTPKNLDLILRQTWRILVTLPAASKSNQDFCIELKNLSNVVGISCSVLYGNPSVINFG